jgi:alkylhydroperoxidase family enzyme
MASTIIDIPWSEPIVPAVSDPAWEAEVKRRAGSVAETYRRIAPVPWLRELCLTIDTSRLQFLSRHLLNVVKMVTSQENSCRYCYGAARAYMRVMGYSESYIGRIERETQHAELDEKERAVIQFCRNLVRSNPRPAGPEREALIRLGFTQPAVTELAFMIAGGCIFNRVTTLIACPPEHAFEQFAYGPLGRMLGLVAPVLRIFGGRTPRAAVAAAAAPAEMENAPFERIFAVLSPLPSAVVLLRTALQDAMASPLLPRRTKALMVGVVGRSLDCNFCQREAMSLSAGDGLSEADVEASLAALGSPKLEPYENSLLTWVRDTVRYQPEAIQQQTRVLSAEIGNLALLEAIGVAALANGVARLAMLLE